MLHGQSWIGDERWLTEVRLESRRLDQVEVACVAVTLFLQGFEDTTPPFIKTSAILRNPQKLQNIKRLLSRLRLRLRLPHFNYVRS